MVRLHNGNITKIPLHTNADGTMTFSTDQFSLYALVAEKKVDAGNEPIEKAASNAHENGPRTQHSLNQSIRVTDARSNHLCHMKKQRNR